MAETSPGLATIAQGTRTPTLPQGDRSSTGERLRSKNVPQIPNLSPKENLLIWQHKQALEDAIKTHSTIILAAGTGTGKTRGGSQIALEALGQTGKMIVTENLRRATEESAKVVAADMGVGVGEEVGVQNRYTHKVSDDTRLLFCPVQSLLIKMENDPLLAEFNLVAMDEVHKESKANELCMIKLRDIQTQRKAKNLPELKLMFISATADKDKITAHFPDAVTVDVPGKTFPVDELFETSSIPVQELPKRAAEKVRGAIAAGDKGNILVFLSGKAQIDAAGDALSAMGLKDTEIIRYYGAAPKEEQERMFADSSKRKVVLATNAAQEALTLDINVIVDTGMHKHTELDVATGRQYLTEQKAPKDHLIQRRGRVGRKESPHPYKYYALMTKSEWDSRTTHEAAEMQRTDLTAEMLILMAQGQSDVYNFRYINTPPRAHINIALNRLEKMGAYKDGKLTEKGRLMALLQVKPNLSSMVASSIDHGCVRQASALAAMMEVYQEALDERKGLPSPFRHTDSDMLGYLQVFNAFTSQEKGQQRQWAQSNGLNYQKLKDAQETYEEIIRVIKEKTPDVNLKDQPAAGALDRSIYEGFADSLIKRSRDESYFMDGVIGDIRIDRDSALASKRPKHFVAIDMRPIFKDERISSRIATLNHVIPDEIVEEANKPKKQADQPAPAATPAPVVEKKQEAPEPTEQPAEKAPAPPPPPPTLGQRIKNWVSNSWIGKVWKWITR